MGFRSAGVAASTWVARHRCWRPARQGAKRKKANALVAAARQTSALFTAMVQAVTSHGSTMDFVRSLVAGTNE